LKDLVVVDFKTGKLQGNFYLGDPFRVVPMEGERLIVCGQSGTWIIAR
jgi:hypothetical protein